MMKILSSKSSTSQDLDTTKTFLIGLAIITCLANYWSIYLPITPLFFILLLPLVIYGAILISKRKRKIYGPIEIALLLFLTVAALCLSLGQTPNIDEAGYYLPLVKWIETYAVTPGTALLNHRIGFNSGFHMLSAVFGIEALLEGGVYKLNGLLFIVFNLYFFRRLFALWKGKNISLADLFLASALVFQFSFLLDSMDSDYLGIMGGIVVIAWSLEALTKPTTNREILALVIIGLFLFTIRPFNAFLLAAPAWLILTQKTYRKHLLFYLLLGVLIVLPWFLRNYYLTGYLIFPIYFLDLFSPDWKVPRQVALASHDIISEFAKLEIIRPEYLYDSMTYPVINEWFPLWVKRTWSMLIGKAVLVLAPLSFLLIIASNFVKDKFRLPKATRYYLIYTLPILAIWFFNYPSLRFGWAWILLLLAGGGMIAWKLTSLSSRVLIILMTLVISLSWLRLAINLNYNNLLQYTIRPIPTKTIHPHKEVVTGHLILKYSEDPHCHGLVPPCLPYNNPLDIEQRGGSIEDGFRLK